MSGFDLMLSSSGLQRNATLLIPHHGADLRLTPSNPQSRISLFVEPWWVRGRDKTGRRMLEGGYLLIMVIIHLFFKLKSYNYSSIFKHLVLSKEIYHHKEMIHISDTFLTTSLQTTIYHSLCHLTLIYWTTSHSSTNCFTAQIHFDSAASPTYLPSIPSIIGWILLLVESFNPIPELTLH